MAKEQDPKTSEAENGTMDFPEYEDEEEWLFKGKDLLFLFFTVTERRKVTPLGMSPGTLFLSNSPGANGKPSPVSPGFLFLMPPFP